MSLETYAALAGALDLRLEVDLTDPRLRNRAQAPRDRDFVHAAMGEFEAARFRGTGFTVAIDEPYQHYQLAGRADVLAWDLDLRALLHIENRTRFPDIQAAAGSWNAKKAYLPAVVAQRLGIRGWGSITHVMACLWSAEVLHTVRLRRETFRSLCPDEPGPFDEWWSGQPAKQGVSSALVVLDPMAQGRQRPFVDLGAALDLATRPRFRGYADAAERLAFGEGVPPRGMPPPGVPRRGAASRG